jgi:hypothetical protein
VAPSLDDLKEFFHDVPQGEERATIIRIGALSPRIACLQRLSSITSSLLLGGVI